MEEGRRGRWEGRGNRGGVEEGRGGKWEGRGKGWRERRRDRGRVEKGRESRWEERVGEGRRELLEGEWEAGRKGRGKEGGKKVGGDGARVGGRGPRRRGEGRKEGGERAWWER